MTSLREKLALASVPALIQQQEHRLNLGCLSFTGWAWASDSSDLEMVRSTAASRIWEQNSATIHVSHTPRLFGGALAPHASQKDNVLHVLASQSSAMVERRQNRSLYGVAGFG